MKELTLQELAKSPAHALEIGKAAEHLVCAELTLLGYRCYLSDQGLPYDIVVDVSGQLLRVQVKATCFAKNVNARGRARRMAYSWSVRRRGRRGQGRLENIDCDIVALVALDARVIAYIPIVAAPQTVQMAPTIETWKHGGPDTFLDISAYPFSAALRGECRRAGQLTHCPAGHLLDGMNTHVREDGTKKCRRCIRERMRKRRANPSQRGLFED